MEGSQIGYLITKQQHFPDSLNTNQISALKTKEKLTAVLSKLTLGLDLFLLLVLGNRI